jgi:hypothetical protein
MTRRRDPDTDDLFHTYLPRSVVQRFSPERVRATRSSARIAQAVRETIRESGKPRDQVAGDMSIFLGEQVTPQMLDQYSSTANEKHNIPAHRLIALLAVTSDVRILNAALHDTGFIALDAKYEALIRRELLKEAGERVTREIANADAQWRAKR